MGKLRHSNLHPGETKVLQKVKKHQLHECWRQEERKLIRTILSWPDPPWSVTFSFRQCNYKQRRLNTEDGRTIKGNLSY